MRLLLICVFTSYSILGFCQNNNPKILTDSTMVLGAIRESTYVGQSISSYCTNGFDKHLEKGEIVVVSGVQSCKNSFSNTETEFFEIFFKNKVYYIEREKLLTDSSNFEQIKNFSPERSNSFKEFAIYAGKVLYLDDMKEALAFLESCKNKGLVILDWSFNDESEYTEGTGAKFKVYNPTQKTIKYLWFTVVGYNPVGDKIIDRRKGTSNITVKAVGPIAKDETGLYEFDYVWFTDLVETMKIISIKVQYMDNSIKTITNVKDITMPDKLYKILIDE